MASGNYRMRRSVPHQVDWARDRRVFLLADCFGRRVIHLDNLRGMKYFDSLVLKSNPLQFISDRHGVADQEKFFELWVFLEGKNCAFDVVFWGEVTAHGIQSDPHTRKIRLKAG